MSARVSSEGVASRATRAMDGGPDCRFHGESALGKETILGVSVSVSSNTVGDRRGTVWRSPDFGCATLKVRHERLIDGHWQLRTESVPLGFQSGEPDARIFQESPLDEVPPSEIMRRLAERDGVDLSECSTCINSVKMQALDSRYYGATRPK